MALTLQQFTDPPNNDRRFMSFGHYLADLFVLIAKRNITTGLFGLGPKSIIRD
jgi:hypothetical protein